VDESDLELWALRGRRSQHASAVLSMPNEAKVRSMQRKGTPLLVCDYRFAHIHGARREKENRETQQAAAAATVLTAASTSAVSSQFNDNDDDSVTASVVDCAGNDVSVNPKQRSGRSV